MSIRFIHRGERSASRLAWGLIPLAVIIGVLLLMRPSADDPGATVTQLDTRPGAVLLAVNAGESTSDATPGFVPPAAARRDRVLQRLGQFRADYRQMAASMAVHYQAGSPDAENLAEVIAQALAQHGLGRGGAVAAEYADKGSEAWNAGLVVHTAQRHEEIVRRLLAALAPYFSAQVLLVFDDARVNELSLHIVGTPAFTEDGLAIFADMVPMDSGGRHYTLPE